LYRLLIADDEGIVLDSIRFILEKNFGEVCDVRTAKSGRMVIEVAQEFAPDIAILDIQMPGINGIEAMKEIRTFNNRMVIIVMSAYDKFTFAQEAMNLGAIEYITKPFNKEKMVDAVQKAMNLIDEVRKKRTNDLLVKEKLQSVVPIIENGFINLILFQEDFSAEMESYRSLLDIREDFGLLITLQFGDQDKSGNLENPVGTSVKIQNYIPTMREIIKEFFLSSVVGSIMANKVAIFVPWQNNTMEFEERSQVIERTRNMVHKLGRQITLQFRAGIGTVRSFVQLHESYEESKKALRIGRGSVVQVQDLMLGCDYEKNYPVDLEEKLFWYVRNGNVEGNRECTNQFFDWMVQNYAEYPQEIRTKVLEIVMNAEREAFLQGGMRYGLLYRKDYLDTVLACSSFEELRQWFVRKVVEATKNVTEKKQEQNNSIVGKAKEYMRNHYTKDLSLEEVAKYVDISPYYFSKLFKEEERENFIDYLISLRIDRAKELLHETEKSIKEVCSEVGYSDPNYFSRIFKKIVGYTPTEYREGAGL
jgi:Response regulator containing CheY-like receiver domain and AraC-type DNA-binding domain